MNILAMLDKFEIVQVYVHVLNKVRMASCLFKIVYWHDNIIIV